MNLKLLRTLHAVAGRAGVSHDEIRDLAEQLLKRDVPTLRMVTDREARRLVDAFEGWHLVDELRRQRGV